MAATEEEGAGEAATAKEEEKEVVECLICMSEVRERGVLDTCAHVYCFACIRKWAEEGENRCPVCRANFHSIRRAPPSGEDGKTDDDVAAAGAAGGAGGRGGPATRRSARRSTRQQRRRRDVVLVADRRQSMHVGEEEEEEEEEDDEEAQYLAWVQAMRHRGVEEQLLIWGDDDDEEEEDYVESGSESDGEEEEEVIHIVDTDDENENENVEEEDQRAPEQKQEEEETDDEVVEVQPTAGRRSRHRRGEVRWTQDPLTGVPQRARNRLSEREREQLLSELRETEQQPQAAASSSAAPAGLRSMTEADAIANGHAAMGRANEIRDRLLATMAELDHRQGTPLHAASTPAPSSTEGTTATSTAPHSTLAQRLAARQRQERSRAANTPARTKRSLPDTDGAEDGSASEDADTDADVDVDADAENRSNRTRRLRRRRATRATT